MLHFKLAVIFMEKYHLNLLMTNIFGFLSAVCDRKWKSVYIYLFLTTEPCSILYISVIKFHLDSASPSQLSLYWSSSLD